LLSYGISENQVLRELYLSDNLIGDTGVIDLANSLSVKKGSSSKLEVLNLSKNNITTAGSEAVFDMAASNKHLVRLNLNANLIGDQFAF